MWATWSRAALAAAESEATGAINVGTGIETDVLELAALLGELGGRDDFEPELAPPRDRRGAADLDRPRPRRARAGLAGARRASADGLRLTLEAICRGGSGRARRH